jgi:hypothetical protein
MLSMANRRRRRRTVALVGVVVLLIAYGLVRSFVLNDEVHQVTTGEALDRYRQHSSTSVAPSPDSTSSTSAVVAPVNLTLPVAGVYLYRTQGTESIDAVGGSVHRYPDETTVTVTAEGCGVELQWDALKERHERWVLCLGEDGILLRPDGGQSFHEFFGQTQTEDITCDHPVLLVPVDGAPRPKESLTCLLGTASWSPAWEVLERSTMQAAGATVEVQHVRMTVNDNDQYFERITLDWYLNEHGLPVKMQQSKDSLSDTSFGDVEYIEYYVAELESLAPLR